MMKTFGNKIFGKMTLFFTFAFCFVLAGMMFIPQTTFAAGESYPGNVTVNNGIQLSGAAFFKNGDTEGSLTGTGTDYNAKYDSATGILELVNYNGGTIATTGDTGKTTIIKLSGINNITDSRFGITAFGGDSVVITSDENATLNIGVNGISSYNQTIAGISAYIFGNPEGSVIVKGNVNLTINVTTGSTDAMESAIGIYAANEIRIEENASLSVKCVNTTNSSTGNVGLFTENGSNQKVTFNTNGNISIDASETNGYSFAIRSSNYTMANANLVTLKWNPGSANNGGEIYGNNDEFNASNWAINIDKTNHVATYKFGTPYAVKVFGGSTNMVSGKFVEGETVNLAAHQSYVDVFGFKKWGSENVTITDATNSNSSFVMPASDVNVIAYYDIFTSEPTFERTSDNSGKITYVLKQAPSSVKWFNINGEQIDTFGTATNASHDIGTFRTPAGTYYIEFTINGGTYRSEPIDIVYVIPHIHSYSSEWISNTTHHYHECECGDKKDNAEHTFGEWTVTKEATETETGLKEKTCTVCSYKETETIPMIAHTHTYGEWKVNATHHYKECTCGQKTAEGVHIYDNIEDKWCNACNYTRVLPILVLTNIDNSSVGLIEDATDPEGKWSWNKSTNTLTLNGWIGKSIQSKETFNIHLKGNNIINMPDNSNANDVYGICTSDRYNYKVIITADDDAKLSFYAINVTGSKNYYAADHIEILSGTMDINMNASSTFTGVLYGFHQKLTSKGNTTININIDSSAVTKSNIYGPAVLPTNSVDITGGAPTLNVNIKAGEKETNQGLYAWFSSPAAAKITVRTSGGKNTHAFMRLPEIKLLEGGFIDFEGGYCRLNFGSYTISPNSKTTIPENNEYKVEKLDGAYYLCDKDGNKLTKARFEYVAEKEPFAIEGGVLEDGIKVFTLPDLYVGDKKLNTSSGWLSLYALLRGYELGKVNFEIIEGTLPEGIDLIQNSSYPSYTAIRGIPTKVTPAGSVTVKATETIGENQSVTFKVKWNAIEMPHTHSYGEWQHDDNNHWKECECGERIENGNHTFGNWTVTKEATETEVGSKERVCTECSYKQTEQIEKLPHTHSYSTDWKINETSHYKDCVCGDINDNEEHTYGEWTTVKEATETEVGSKERVCTICNHKQTEEIVKLPHTHIYSTDWKFDITSHYKDCACGEKKDVANHEYTDDNDDTCNTCGFKRTINNPTPTPSKDEGLSGGAIAAIVVTSVVVLSLGGFSVFWFVIKKKSFKDLIKIFKK